MLNWYILQRYLLISCNLIIINNFTYISRAPSMLDGLTRNSQNTFFCIMQPRTFLSREQSKTTRFKMSRKSVGVMQCYWFVNNRENAKKNHLAWKFIQHFFLFLLTLCTHNSTRSHGWLKTCSWRVSNCWRTLDTTAI